MAHSDYKIQWHGQSAVPRIIAPCAAQYVAHDENEGGKLSQLKCGHDRLKCGLGCDISRSDIEGIATFISGIEHFTLWHDRTTSAGKCHREFKSAEGS